MAMPIPQTTDRPAIFRLPGGRKVVIEDRGEKADGAIREFRVAHIDGSPDWDNLQQGYDDLFHRVVARFRVELVWKQGLRRHTGIQPIYTYTLWVQA